MKQVQELRAEADVKIAAQEVELSKILSEKPLEEQTVFDTTDSIVTLLQMDEYLTARPQLRKKIHDDLEKGEW